MQGLKVISADSSAYF